MTPAPKRWLEQLGRHNSREPWLVIAWPNERQGGVVAAKCRQLGLAELRWTSPSASMTGNPCRSALVSLPGWKSPPFPGFGAPLLTSTKVGDHRSTPLRHLAAADLARAVWRRNLYKIITIYKCRYGYYYYMIYNIMILYINIINMFTAASFLILLGSAACNQEMRAVQTGFSSALQDVLGALGCSERHVGRQLARHGSCAQAAGSLWCPSVAGNISSPTWRRAFHAWARSTCASELGARRSGHQEERGRVHFEHGRPAAVQQSAAGDLSKAFRRSAA